MSMITQKSNVRNISVDYKTDNLLSFGCDIDISSMTKFNTECTLYIKLANKNINPSGNVTIRIDDLGLYDASEDLDMKDKDISFHDNSYGFLIKDIKICHVLNEDSLIINNIPSGIIGNPIASISNFPIDIDLSIGSEFDPIADGILIKITIEMGKINPDQGFVYVNNGSPGNANAMELDRIFDVADLMFITRLDFLIP